MGSLTSSSGNKHYVFAEVNVDANTVTQVYFCCDCSQLSLTIPQEVYFADREGPSINIPVTAVGSIEGTYSWTVATSPSHGDVTIATSPAQTGNSATFNYTPRNESFTYDSFSVTLTNSCGTSSILTIPIVRNFSLDHTDTDVTIMVDTASVSLSDALTIKSSFEVVKSLMQSNNSNWTGTFNYVAVDSSTNRSGDYIKHVLGMVENIGTATALTNPSITTFTTGAWYTQFMGSGTTLPSYWSGATATYPSSVFVISFVNTTNSTSTYGAATLGIAPEGWSTPTQPTTLGGGAGASKYQEDYDSLIDITSGAAVTSAWGIEASGTKNPYWTNGSIPFRFKHVIVNKITGSNNVSAAAALQMSSALTGPTDLTNQEFLGMKIGGPVYPVDLSAYLKNGVSAIANPYNNTVTTPAGNTLDGLEVSFDISSHLYLENGVDWATSTNDNMKKYMFRNGWSRTKFFYRNSNKRSSRKNRRFNGCVWNRSYNTAACTNATSSSPAIWSPGATTTNTTPSNPFTGTVLTNRAYTTQSAASNGQGTYELVGGNYYAIYLATGTRYRAQYNKTADPSGNFWTNISTC